MTGLRELQTRFVAALFDGAVAPFAPHIEPNGIDSADRLDIYRNNLREGFIKALALGFPVIERLVGVDYFRQLALDFQREHPSRAGNLHHIGAPFSQFLKQRFVGTEHSEYAYLADIAALEWTRECALIAPEAAPIAPDDLRAIAPEHYESLVFQLHPACGLVRSQFPIVRIWRANQSDAGNEEIIDLRSSGDNVLVLRAADGIEFHPLPAGEFVALHAFTNGLNLGAALEAAQAADPAFDLGAALRHFMNLNILTGLDLPAAAS